MLYLHENTDGKGSFQTKVVDDIVGSGVFFEVISADLDAEGARRDVWQAERPQD